VSTEGTLNIENEQAKVISYASLNPADIVDLNCEHRKVNLVIDGLPEASTASCSS